MDKLPRAISKLSRKLPSLLSNSSRQISTSSVLQIENAKPQANLSYVSCRSTIPLLPDSVGQRLLYAAEKFENREAYVFPESGTRVTFKELKEQAEKLALSLVALGLEKGDRIGIWAPNRFEWILTQYATGLAGIIQVNINPAYKSHELEYSLNKVGCKAIIMSETYKSQDYVKILKEVCPELNDATKSGLTVELKSKRVPTLKNVIILSDKEYNGCIPFNQLMKQDHDSSVKNKLKEMQNKIQASDPINIQYTSGTTGSPKGVTLSHHMIINNAFQLTYGQNYHVDRTVSCLPVPLYHCLGMVMGSLSSVCHGITIVVPCATFNAEQALEAIEKERCTTVYGTPTMFVDMIHHPNFLKYDMSSMNSAIMAGSTCPRELVNDCVHKLNARNVIVAYGLTEAAPVITMGTIHDPLEMRTLTIGRAVEHCEIKVVDSEGKIVPVGEPGELWVRGYNTMIGYWEDKAKTDETYTTDRFLKTGDIVRVDEEGYFHHLGRLKDMVIRGGENIYPKEIEDFLHEHPKIADVHVIGLPDKRMGEELCACIRLVNDSKMEEKELKTYCKERIAHFKVPRYVVFMNEFPMTVTGKVQKNKLREQMIAKFGLSK